MRALFAGRGEITLIVLVTGILYAIAWPTLQLTHQVPAPLQPLIAGLAAFPFVLVRANPVLGWSISIAAAIVIPVAFNAAPGAPGGPPWQVVHILVLLALYIAVCLTEVRAQVAAVWVGTTIVFALFAPGSDWFGWVVGLTAILVFTVLLRRLWLSRRQLERQEQLSRTERSRRAVLEERARIARDLHDVVAHHMSLVVVQAQTAQYRIGGLGPETTAEFDSIAGTAREALDEVRAMLGVLRSDEHTAERAPQPGVDRIGELIEGSRRAGIDARYEATGDASRIRTAAGVVLYRIVQESLSNATRHAPGARVQVSLCASEQEVTVRIANGPPSGASGGGLPGRSVVDGDGDDGTGGNGIGGNGIRGMRERAAAVGGTLTAEAGSDGGFVVRAVLPVAEPAHQGG
ncbi:sensor histidine kinase [Tomitella fengzijianii]|uniref:sensor histidine kinase n=1 Tax=Tomitella fengzijianii TaxID=2597660 RepID=UPI001E30CB57|nr:histidine kinase [Tomitella fengzijianii]